MAPCLFMSRHARDRSSGIASRISVFWSLLGSGSTEATEVAVQVLIGASS
jgi:hypothetical protein